MVLPPVEASSVGRVIGRGAERAAEQEGSFLDVWSRTVEGDDARLLSVLSDPLGEMQAEIDGRLRQYHAASREEQTRQSWDASWAAFAASGGSISAAWDNLGKAEGALGKVGAFFGFMTAVEQSVSTLFSAIPSQALPAVRVLDMEIGLPHTHNHPPNLTPAGILVPLPSAGPVIPIPFLSGSATVLINGMPAARCGDMGVGVWCGGFFPMYEIFLGSSSVWLEGARAARVGCDITRHCTFTVPKPQDPPLGAIVGTTVESSPNVSIGGVPLPSLTALAFAGAFKLLFAGFSRLRGFLRAADDVGEEATDAVRRAATPSPRTPGQIRAALPKMAGALGDDVIELAQRSPSLMDELRRLEADGWKVRTGTPGGGSFADRHLQEIVLDPNHMGSRTEAIQTLSHEVGHARYNYTPDYSSRQRYIDGALADEGVATMENIRTQREILGNGGEDIGVAGNPANHQAYNNAYDQFLQDGDAEKCRNAMGQRFGNHETTSTTGQTYEEYHGSWYDNNIP